MLALVLHACEVTAERRRFVEVAGAAFHRAAGTASVKRQDWSSRVAPHALHTGITNASRAVLVTTLRHPLSVESLTSPARFRRSGHTLTSPSPRAVAHRPNAKATRPLASRGALAGESAQAVENEQIADAVCARPQTAAPDRPGSSRAAWITAAPGPPGLRSSAHEPRDWNAALDSCTSCSVPRRGKNWSEPVCRLPVPADCERDPPERLTSS